ncbi:MAG: MgtC/SapB family protein [Pseudomonadota bacterium]
MPLFDTVQGFLVALGIGLLVGVDRERRKGRERAHGVAGLRTFALAALLGAVAHELGPVAMAVAGAFVTAASLASWFWTRARDPGLTTETALLVVFLLGMVAMREPVLAGGLGVAVAVLLAAKSQLHRFARSVLSEQELHDALMLAAGALIVLPLLPDDAIDPWGVLNPRALWLLVLLVIAINAGGHVALRLFGARGGLLFAGFAGGFVSSTATIAALGVRAKATPAVMPACVSAAVVSNLSTVIQLALITGALSPRLTVSMAGPLLAAALAVLAFAAIAGWRGRDRPPPEGGVLADHAFKLRYVLMFVAVLSAVMLASAAALAYWGHAALGWTLALSGFADVHSAAATAAQLVAVGHVPVSDAGTGVLAALATNSLMKLLMALASGGRGYALRVLPGVAAMVAAFAAALWLGA